VLGDPVTTSGRGVIAPVVLAVVLASV